MWTIATMLLLMTTALLAGSWNWIALFSATATYLSAKNISSADSVFAGDMIAWAIVVVIAASIISELLS